MELLDFTAASLAANLALDEVLLRATEAGERDELLRFWEWPHLAVVLGASGSIAIDVHEDACQRDGVPLARRSSGGGTVLLGQGCLLYSLVLRTDRAAELRDIRASYGWILQRVTVALQPLADGRIEQAGISDLAIAGRKFSGNAQQRKQHAILHHGSLLYAFPLPSIDRYLNTPERQPDYRGQRGHADFVRNLPVARASLLSALTQAWQAKPGSRVLPFAQVKQLLSDKYQRSDWLRRR